MVRAIVYLDDDVCVETTVYKRPGFHIFYIIHEGREIVVHEVFSWGKELQHYAQSHPKK